MDAPKTARAWLDVVLDDGYDLLFEDVIGGDPLGFPGYAEQLERARETTGCSESVLVAAGTIDGARALALSFEFAFLGGSMGVAAGERICRAFELGAREGIPVVALTASGGARMQEGMLALAQMPATLAARARLAGAHQPFIAYLRNPTTGGVYASFASSADVIWAEPGATVGFAGPRVAETFTGRPLPTDSHTAEWCAERGLVHEVIPARDLRARIEPLVRIRGFAEGNERPAEPVASADDAWSIVERARSEERLRASHYFTTWSRSTIDGLTTGIGFAGGTGAVIVAMEHAPMTARGYRAARDAIATAERLHLPIVVFIDTSGADPSAEADGIAREVSRTMDALQNAPVPTIACVVGEGGSGGALALAACDRVLVQERAFFSVIAPEGAAAILRRDDVEQVARDLRLTARDLRRSGLADLIVAESSQGAVTKAMLERDVHARTFVRDAMQKAVAWALYDIEQAGGAPTARRFDRWRTWRP